jgi:hypothetical protein
VNESSVQYLTLLADCTAALERAAESLKFALEGMRRLGGVSRQTYLMQQAESVAAVAFDVCLLVNNRRFQNVVGLCRIGFESRIHVFAAMRVPEFAAQKYIAQIEGNIKELSRPGLGSGNIKTELERQKLLLDQMREDFGYAPERKWNLYEAARDAGLKADYEEHYSLLSKAAHNTPAGLASKDDLRIVVSSVLRLFHDAVETCSCLVFFRERDEDQAHPLTTKWAELADPVGDMTTEFGELSYRLNCLLKADFPE